MTFVHDSINHKTNGHCDTGKGIYYVGMVCIVLQLYLRLSQALEGSIANCTSKDSDDGCPTQETQDYREM